MIHKILDILTFIFGLSGAILVGQKIAIGFLSFVISSACQAVVMASDKRYGTLAMCLTFIVIDIYYYIDWIWS